MERSMGKLNYQPAQVHQSTFKQAPRLRTCWGNTASFQYNTGTGISDRCICGSPQTIDHMLKSCPIYKPPHGLEGLVELDKETLQWLDSDIPV